MALTPKQRKAALDKGLNVDLSLDDTKYIASPNPRAASRLFARSSPLIEQPESLPSDGRPEALPADRMPRQTVDRKHYRQTVSQNYRQTPPSENLQTSASLPADRLTDVTEELVTEGIPLAPVQWAVWEALREAETAGRIVSYRKLAAAANATIRGVRDALAVIEKEGGVRSKVTVRTADEQGLHIELDPLRRFKRASLEETKGLLRRGDDYRQTVYRKSLVLPSDGLRLSVCSNINIKQTDIGGLLRVTPPEWKIRERTLTEIANTFPNMTALEFRRSLMHLVEQARSSSQPIQNHNAWIKAAFAKNEGPLVTENMIEAQIDQVTTAGQGKTTQHKQEDIQADLGVLKRYLLASPEEKAAIDQAAEEKAARALSIASAWKREEIIEHARLECAREFFAEATKRC